MPDCFTSYKYVNRVTKRSGPEACALGHLGEPCSTQNLEVLYFVADKGLRALDFTQNPLYFGWWRWDGRCAWGLLYASHLTRRDTSRHPNFTNAKLHNLPAQLFPPWSCKSILEWHPRTAPPPFLCICSSRINHSQPEPTADTCSPRGHISGPWPPRRAPAACLPQTACTIRRPRCSRCSSRRGARRFARTAGRLRRIHPLCGSRRSRRSTLSRASTTTARMSLP